MDKKINIPNAIRVNNQGAYATVAELEWLAEWAHNHAEYRPSVFMIGAGPGVMAIALYEGNNRVSLGIVDNQNLEYAKEHIRGTLDRTQGAFDVMYYLSDSAEFGVKTSHQPGGNLDLLIIDGDHSYVGVRRDIGAWWPHVKAGGIVLFHDYLHNLEGTKTGVKQAFDEMPVDNWEPVAEFDLSKIVRKVQVDSPILINSNTDKNLLSALTVVTPVGPYPHNVRWINECLESVSNQTVKPYEHILVDDGANLPKSLEVSNRRIVVCPEHVGAGSVNLGIEAAETEWILILNSDDSLMDKAVEKLTAEIGVYRPSYIRFCVNCSDGTLSAAGQCFHKSVWEQVGRYPNNFQLDYWLVDKIIRASIPIHDSVYSDIYFHRYHDEQMSKTGLT